MSVNGIKKFSRVSHEKDDPFFRFMVMYDIFEHNRARTVNDRSRFIGFRCIVGFSACPVDFNVFS